MKQKILLIHTDGYDIEITEFDDPAAAQQAMQKAYHDLKPSKLAPEWADLSYCDNDSENCIATARMYTSGNSIKYRFDTIKNHS